MLAELAAVYHRGLPQSRWLDDGYRLGRRVDPAAIVRHGERHRVGPQVGKHRARSQPAGGLTIPEVPRVTDNRPARRRLRSRRVDLKWRKIGVLAAAGEFHGSMGERRHSERYKKTRVDPFPRLRPDLAT